MLLKSKGSISNIDLAEAVTINNDSYVQIEFENEREINSIIDPKGNPLKKKGYNRDIWNILDARDAGNLPKNFKLGEKCLTTRLGSRYFHFDIDDQLQLYLKVRGGEYLARKSYKSIVLNSGPCLFSINGAKAKHADDESTTLTMPGIDLEKDVIELIIDEKISVYELESISRLSKVIGWMSNVDCEMSVNVNIPRIEYYLYIMDAYQKGLLNKDIAMSWIEHVEHRSDKMRDLYVRSIKSNTNRKINIKNGNILDDLDHYIRAKVSEDEVPNLHDMLLALSYLNPLMAQIIDFYKPKNYFEINYLGYMYEEIKNAIVEDQLCIAIENHTEEKIYDKAWLFGEKLVNEGKIFNLSGIYPYPKLIDSEGNYLYYTDIPLNEPIAKSIDALYQTQAFSFI